MSTPETGLEVPREEERVRRAHVVRGTRPDHSSVPVESGPFVKTVLDMGGRVKESPVDLRFDTSEVGSVLRQDSL